MIKKDLILSGAVNEYIKHTIIIKSVNNNEEKLFTTGGSLPVVRACCVPK